MHQLEELLIWCVVERLLNLEQFVADDVLNETKSGTGVVMALCVDCIML